MTRIVIYENSVNDILDMVQDIKSLGYVMDQDFTWAWHPEDSYTGEQEYAVSQPDFYASLLRTGRGFVEYPS